MPLRQVSFNSTLFIVCAAPVLPWRIDMMGLPACEVAPSGAPRSLGPLLSYTSPVMVVLVVVFPPETWRKQRIILRATPAACQRRFPGPCSGIRFSVVGKNPLLILVFCSHDPAPSRYGPAVFSLLLSDSKPVLVLG